MAARTRAKAQLGRNFFNIWHEANPGTIAGNELAGDFPAAIEHRASAGNTPLSPRLHHLPP